MKFISLGAVWFGDTRLCPLRFWGDGRGRGREAARVTSLSRPNCEKKSDILAVLQARVPAPSELSLAQRPTLAQHTLFAFPRRGHDAAGGPLPLLPPRVPLPTWLRGERERVNEERSRGRDATGKIRSMIGRAALASQS